MSSDQVARLAATIEVLTGAVHFLLAERVQAQPGAVQGELLNILQRGLSAPPRPEEALAGRAALAQADLARWMPVVAAGMVDEVRRQIGREPEGMRALGQDRLGRARTDGRGSEGRWAGEGRAGLEPPPAANRSEVAERPDREHARGALAHFETGRAVA